MPQNSESSEAAVSQTANAEQPSLAATLTLEALKVIKESQQQHGLRHMDYQRYRAYCTRRVRRVRKTLHVQCGHRKYQKRELTQDDLADSKILLIPLFQAERAWSYAMQLKQEANTEPRKRFHLLNRLRKAVRHANQLEQLSQSAKCDARTKLEAQGYQALMQGLFNFEMQQWKESLESFIVAKNIYEKLSVALRGDDSQVFYNQKCEEIEPNLRYCSYKLGDKSAQKDLINLKLKSTAGSQLSETIDTLISETKEKQVITFSEVNWRNKIPLQIKSDKIRFFLSNVQEYEKQLQSTHNFDAKIKIYESILKESVDTIQIVRDELKLDPLFQKIQKGASLQMDDKPSNSLLLFGYLSWTRITKTIERNLLMLDVYTSQLATSSSQVDDGSKAKSVKPQDIVRLYDIIVQNHTDMAQLPGLVADQEYQSDSELSVLFYKTFRAYYIGLFYLAIKKYKEAIGFCFKVDSYFKQLDQMIGAMRKTELKLDEMKSRVEKLRTDLEQFKYKIQAEALLEDKMEDLKELEQNRDKLEKIALTDRLDIYLEDSSLCTQANVARLALNFEPVQCKPLFFDLALNHLELPNLEDKIEQKQQSQQGVKGFFKGFFGYR
ncbi:signal recognition particle subunit SRP68 [Brachionus plicatilis]|uniref:Signal recognition particle subunit SRP68 n=1 Tax=Brachionus plicatilis TaxID=10195 RepID=A0A3M7SB63_BRAPC|nr:signal recognition particle subunit SRP68 [Brachionus plicatilis]